MSTNYETGHAKNVANFQVLIAHVSGYGASYNPSRASIQLSNLMSTAAVANAAIANLNLLLPNYSNAVAARENAFAPLSKMSTKIFNFLKASDALTKVIDNAQTNHRKITGQRASVKIGEEERQALLAKGEEVNQISASQQSFDSRLDSFDKQIKLLATIPSYAPNEAELQLQSLQNLYNDMQSKNAMVLNQSIPVNVARIARNEALYDPETGIVAVAQDVKSYVKAVFGASNANYKLISGIAIRTVKI